MYKRYIATVLSAVFAVVSIHAAAQSEGIAASGIKLTLGADSVLLEMTVRVSPGAVHDLHGVELVPVLSDGEDRGIRFPGVLVNGRNRARIYERRARLGNEKILRNPPFRVVNLVRGSGGETIDYSARAAAGDWTEGASLHLVYELISPAEKRRAYSLPVTAEIAAE